MPSMEFTGLHQRILYPTLHSLQSQLFYQTKLKPLPITYTQHGNVTERQSGRKGHGPW